MRSHANYIPHYLTSRQNTTRTILWTALWAWLFITVYQPFNSRLWLSNMSDVTYFLWASAGVLVAMCVIALSRTCMYQYSKKHDLSYIDFGVWIGMEIIAMSLVYAIVPQATHVAQVPFLRLWGEAAKYTAFVLLIPYAILTMAFIISEQQKELIRAGIREGRLREEREIPGMYNFHDERGELKLSIRPDTLYYIESADNYVQIHYLHTGKINHFMLRSSLRNIEETFEGKELMRCHRSYIVNFTLVKLLKRTEEGLVLDFDTDKVPNIPVSKRYSQKVLDRFYKEAE